MLLDSEIQQLLHINPFNVKPRQYYEMYRFYPTIDPSSPLPLESYSPSCTEVYRIKEFTSDPIHQDLNPPSSPPTTRSLIIVPSLNSQEMEI